MSDTVNPQIDNANEGSLAGVITQALRGFELKLEHCLPATVISYDRVANVASLQPNIQMVATDGTLVGRAPLASIPVIALGGGGFNITFPLVAGSKGWIHAGDRDISLYLQSGGMTPPNTQHAHTFSAGHFVPDVLANYVLNGEDANNMVIQNTAGNVRIAIWPDQIKLTVDGSSLVLNSTGVVVTGTLTATGAITGGFGTGDQVNLLTHKHPTAGTGSPSSPTPGT